MVEPDNAVSDPGYYLAQATMTPPQFLGKGSKLLGIHGTWSEQSFLRLFQGYSPDSEKLAQRIRSDRRGAVDWTFNQDKSVSVAELVGGDSRITELRRKSVLKAMDLLEKSVQVKVRKQSTLMASKARHPKGWKYPERKTGNLIYSMFDHPDSRAGDPNGHTHAVIHNLSFDREEGIWKAIELRYADRRALADVYHKAMHKGLRKLGYDASYDGRAVTIPVPGKVQAEFSRRQAQVLETKAAYEARGGLSPKGKKKVQLFDRPEKEPDRPLPERRKSWVGRLTGPQYRGVRVMVAKAKDALKSRRFRLGLKRDVDRSRRVDMVRSKDNALER